MIPYDDPHTNGPATEMNGNANDLIPGITFPDKVHSGQENGEQESPPTSFEGPQVNGRPTTVTLFSPAQLEKSPFLPSLEKVINEAFSRQESSGTIKLVPRPRLRYNGQLFEELGKAPGTFTYVITYAGTNDVVATAGGKRYLGTVLIVEKDQYLPENTFQRFGSVEEGTEAWELSTMAVDPGVQRQGIAGYLMRLTDAEMKRRFESHGVGEGRKSLMLLTTIKEVNGSFYAKRGWKLDYEVKYEKGHLESETGFIISHMSKEVGVSDT